MWTCLWRVDSDPSGASLSRSHCFALWSEGLSAEPELPWSQQGCDGRVPEPHPDLTASESKGKD